MVIECLILCWALGTSVFIVFRNRFSTGIKGWLWEWHAISTGIIPEKYSSARGLEQFLATWLLNTRLCMLLNFGGQVWCMGVDVVSNTACLWVVCKKDSV
jgi:hypothetical protein